MATKIHSGIEKRIRDVAIPSLMAASNMFGRGFSTKKMELILDEYPNILTSVESLDEKKRKLAQVKGMAAKTADNFVDHIPNFMSFLQDTGLQGKIIAESVKPVVNEGHILYKKSIVMSGTRDKPLEDELASVGASIGTSVSSKTFALITPDADSDSSKVTQARKLAIPIFTPEEFRHKYLH
jgi:NAD-dependent DNA ligase